MNADPIPPSPEVEIQLKESLRRCSPETIEAAISYGRTHDPKFLPIVITGIFERYVEPDIRPKLTAASSDDLRVIEDLGIDSLTMMEIVMLVEEASRLTIANDELRQLRTLGDIRMFVDCRARGLPYSPPASLNHEAVMAVMPVQPPFLFIDEAVVSKTAVSATYRITGEEVFLQGHFKGNPVMPGSLMLEALGQLGVLYLVSGQLDEETRKVDAASLLFTSADGVRCHRICRPGDALSLRLKPKRIKPPLAVFEGDVRVGAEKAVGAEEIILTFGFRETPPATP